MNWEVKQQVKRPLLGSFVPSELVGKTVNDAYDFNGQSFIEFTDGTIIQVVTTGLTLAQTYPSHDRSIYDRSNPNKRKRR